MTGLSVAALRLGLLPMIGYGQGERAANAPFTLTSTEGRCVGCKIATGLGHAQFVTRKDVWAVGIHDSGTRSICRSS